MPFAGFQATFAGFGSLKTASFVVGIFKE